MECLELCVKGMAQVLVYFFLIFDALQNTLKPWACSLTTQITTREPC
jgi:hypothetical protein